MSTAHGGPASTYAIRSVVDFLQVPAARRELCLREFHAWLTMHDAVLDAVTDLSSAGIVAMQWNGVFNWVDDDKGQFTIRLLAPDGVQLGTAKGDL